MVSAFTWKNPREWESEWGIQVSEVRSKQYHHWIFLACKYAIVLTGTERGSHASRNPQKCAFTTLLQHTIKYELLTLSCKLRSSSLYFKSNLICPGISKGASYYSFAEKVTFLKVLRTNLNRSWVPGYLWKSVFSFPVFMSLQSQKQHRVQCSACSSTCVQICSSCYHNMGLSAALINSIT